MVSVVMWKIACFLVIICCVFSVTSVQKNESIIELIVEQVRHLKYYQLLIFKNSKRSFQNLDFKLVKFMKEMKAVLIDIEDMKYANDNELYTSSLRIFRTSTLCIILEDGEIDDRIQSAHAVMKFLIEASPASTRPKCLMVTDNDAYSEKGFTSILLKAWSLQFLDFTIVFLKDGGPPQMLSYNPFTESYSTGELTNTSLLFPDKLSNMNQYSLKIPIYNLPPYNSFSFENGRITSVKGYDYSYIEIFSEKLNFSLQYSIVKVPSNVTALFEKLILLLENNKVNVIPKPLYLGIHYYGRDVVIGKPYRDTNYVLVVPIIRMSEMRIYMRILSKISYFPINVLILNFAFRVLGFRLNQWIHLLQMLVGSALTRQPMKMAERIVFFTVVLLSMIFSSDIFASLTDTKVANNEVPFETYEDILSSNLTVYARMTASEKENALFEELEARNVQNISKCIVESARTKCCICIAPKLAAMYLIDIHEDQDKPTLKISRLRLYSEKMAFGFEKASPYVEKIDLVLQALIEAGIQYSWKSTQIVYDKLKHRRMRRCGKMNPDAPDCSERIVFQLTAMLLFFHSITSVIFVVELLTKKIGPRVRRTLLLNNVFS